MSKPDVMTQLYEEKMQRIASLELDLKTLRAILENPEKWMKWCDIKVFERHKELAASLLKMKEALGRLVEEVEFVIKGGDDIHDACPGCGCAGIGMMRDALHKAKQALTPTSSMEGGRK
jgi:hypothetical protein